MTEGVVAVRIGEVAAAAGTTPRVVRHYEHHGLVRSSRSQNGYRVFDPGAVVRVQNVRRLVDAGLTLEDVRVFLDCLDGDVAGAPPSARGLEVARRRLAAVQERIDAHVEVRDRLASAIEQALAREGGRRDETGRCAAGGRVQTAAGQAIPPLSSR